MSTSSRSVCETSRHNVCHWEEGEGQRYACMDMIFSLNTQPCTGGTIIPRIQERVTFGSTDARNRRSKVHRLHSDYMCMW